MEHLENNIIFYDWQHGFRSKRSTETQLLTLIHELSIKLDYYDIRSSTLRWINSFLSDHTQKGIPDDAVSDTVKVTSGVPQGSLLGHIIFLIYINDLPNSLSSKNRFFADDAIVYIKINSHQNCSELQNDLNKLMAWKIMWLM